MHSTTLDHSYDDSLDPALDESLGVPTRQLTVTVNGVDVTYHDSIDDHGSGRTLVLVHGTFGTTRSHYGYLFPLLAARQRVVSIDLADTPAEVLQAADLEDQVVAVIEAAGAAQVTLVGYSLGAVIALGVAERLPDRVRGLVVAAGWLTTDRQQLLRNDVWRHLRAVDDRLLREYSAFCAFGGPFLASRPDREIDAMLAAMSVDRFGDRQMDLNRRIDVAERAERITATTLVVGCTHDLMAPVRHSKAIFGAIVDARYAEIDTGHAVVFERPSQLCDLVQSFVEDPDSTPAGALVEQSQP